MTHRPPNDHSCVCGLLQETTDLYPLALCDCDSFHLVSKQHPHTIINAQKDRSLFYMYSFWGWWDSEHTPTTRVWVHPGQFSVNCRADVTDRQPFTLVNSSSGSLRRREVPNDSVIVREAHEILAPVTDLTITGNVIVSDNPNKNNIILITTDKTYCLHQMLLFLETVCRVLSYLVLIGCHKKCQNTT